MTAGPFSPPLSRASRLSTRNRLLGFSGPWHLRQDASSTGLMSRRKSTLSVAGGGSLLSSIGAEKTVCSKARAASKQVVQRRTILRTRREYLVCGAVGIRLTFLHLRVSGSVMQVRAHV